MAPSRLVEIIGEAASRVLAEVQERHPKRPWRDAGYYPPSGDLYFDVMTRLGEVAGAAPGGGRPGTAEPNGRGL